MIELTLLNGKPLFINPVQMECIRVIPETKVIMMNGKYHIVKESPHDIVAMVMDFYQKARMMVSCVGTAESGIGEEAGEEE